MGEHKGTITIILVVLVIFGIFMLFSKVFEDIMNTIQEKFTTLVNNVFSGIDSGQGNLSGGK